MKRMSSSQIMIILDLIYDMHFKMQLSTFLKIAHLKWILTSALWCDKMYKFIHSYVVSSFLPCKGPKREKRISHYFETLREKPN